MLLIVRCSSVERREWLLVQVKCLANCLLAGLKCLGTFLHNVGSLRLVSANTIEARSVLVFLFIGVLMVILVLILRANLFKLFSKSATELNRLIFLVHFSLLLALLFHIIVLLVLMCGTLKKFFKDLVSCLGIVGHGCLRRYDLLVLDLGVGFGVQSTIGQLIVLIEAVATVKDMLG